MATVPIFIRYSCLLRGRVMFLLDLKLDFPFRPIVIREQSQDIIVRLNFMTSRGDGWRLMPMKPKRKRSDPAVVLFYFGNQKADRKHFTSGRDIQLQGDSSGALNYFIYPHIFAEGKVIKDFNATFTYHDI